MRRYLPIVRAAAHIGFGESVALLVNAFLGLLLVRWMSKDSYAEYSFLTAGASLLFGLAGAAVNHAFLPTVSRLASAAADPDHVPREIRRWQRGLLLVAAMPVLPYCAIVGARQGWTSPVWVAGLVTMLVWAVSQLEEQVRRTRASSVGAVLGITRANLLTAALRTGAVGIALVTTSGAVAVVALVGANALASLGSAYWLGTAAPAQRKIPAASPALRARINQSIRTVFVATEPLVVYTILQATVASLIIGAVGSATSLAEVGALSRLSLVLALIDRVIGTIIIPRVSRMKDAEFRGHVVPFLALYGAVMASLALSAALAPGLWILLLGPKYAAQHDLVWIAVLGAVLMNAGGLLFTISAARGTPGVQWPVIAAVIVVEIACARFLDFTQARGAMLFALIQAAVFVAYQGALFARLVGRDRPSNPPSAPLVAAALDK